MSIRLTGIAVMLTMLLCVSTVGAFEFDKDSPISKNWGTSFQAQKKAQIANPDAGTVTGPVEGFDGKAAGKTMDVFHESFSQENARQGYSLDTVCVEMGGGQ